MSHGSIADRITLRDGVQAPRYVFGTGGIKEPVPIHHALKEGYRAFDTAQMYGNEAEVGEAIRSYPEPVDRKDLFIVTKVKEPSKDVEETLEGIKESVKKIGLGGYVDLMLVHNPNAGPEGRKIEWLALEQAKKEGLIRSIGVSNYVVHHLEGMKDYASEMPEVNQTELSPFNQDLEVAEWCKKNGVVLQAFAPVCRGKKADDPTLLEIAKEVGKNWNKVLLRYGYQKNYMVTCKSQTPSRITDNVEIFDFELSPPQMEKMDKLECGFKVTPSTLDSVEARRRYYTDMP